MVPSQILSPEFPACFGSSSSPPGMTRPVGWEWSANMNLTEQASRVYCLSLVSQRSTGPQSCFTWHKTRIPHRCKAIVLMLTFRKYDPPTSSCNLPAWGMSSRWPLLKCCSTNINKSFSIYRCKNRVTLDFCLKSYYDRQQGMAWYLWKRLINLLYWMNQRGLPHFFLPLTLPDTHTHTCLILSKKGVPKVPKTSLWKWATGINISLSLSKSTWSKGIS